MNRSRGFSLAELLMTSVLTVIVVGTLASLFLHVSSRTAHSVADVSTVIQQQQVFEAIGTTINNAIVCEVVTGGGNTGLKCIIPNAGTDKTGDGIFDRTFVPSGVSRRQIPKYTYGQRVWYYRSDSTGAWANSGNILWRGVRNDDAYPVAGDADTAWSLHYGTTTPRWHLVDTISFTVDGANKAVTVALQTSALPRADRTAAVAEETSLAYTLPISRTFYMRNWRK